ncbi:glycosyltransferase [Streptomonospora sp. S1-112]|uniref:Glycosyltransferase n=1 Tax=Streptomonospora mangrovi TaxID=2883123 RepID=A0A9X3NKX2_9ACTN|nr:glycosyltransferase [Streptomonospora mangrovi]MDA0565639.1 glycosyltransferase [Streptomonospora mangrovi]
MGIVIATRDRRAELATTLRRLAAAQPGAPVTVVDNASTDGTPDLVAEEFPRVRLVRLPENLGCAARNVGVRHTPTDYVAFCDDDSWWPADALARAAAAFDAHPRLGLVAAATFVGEEERPDPINDLLARGLGPAPPGLPGPRVLGFLACAAIVRREAFLAAGGFSELLFFTHEEALLAQDLAALGWEACYLPEVRAHHHPSRSRPPGAWRRRLELRNRVLVHWLRRPAGRALGATAQLAAAAASAPEARGALADVARDLPRTLRARRRLPARVERDLRVLER